MQATSKLLRFSRRPIALRTFGRPSAFSHRHAFVPSIASQSFSSSPLRTNDDGGVVRKSTATSAKKEETTSDADDQHHHETRPHHPLRSDIDHLESPTSSEEASHADRLPGHLDPLPKEKKASKGAREFSTSARSYYPAGKKTDGEEKAKGSPVHHHEDAKPTDSEEAAHAEAHAEDPLGKLDGSKKKGKKSAGDKKAKREFSTSASTFAKEEHHTPQHPESTSIPHLEKPTLTEEFVHADKHTDDPLKGKKKVGGAPDSKEVPVQGKD